MAEDYGLDADAETPAKLGHVYRLRAKTGTFAKLTIEREDALEERIERLERQVELLMLARERK